MSSLPRVAETTRERIAREFDNLGPDACVGEISDSLRRNNPELLDMATKWARDVGHWEELMMGFCMFYRLLVAQGSTAHGPQASSLDPLPHVTPQTRALVARRIDEEGTESFTRESIEELERSNPELLQVAHRFAARQQDYLGAMQGFGLVYACLTAQLAADRAHPH
jgi:hypothetical protein